MDEPPSHLFLSYASADRDRAFQVAAALRAEGVRVWIDRSEIAGGTGWAETIATAVRTCSALAVLCSAQSVQSRNVRQELQLAWDHARPILPLLLEPLTFPDGVAYFLQGTQWLQIHDRSPDAWLPEIVAAVRRFGSPPIDATPTHQAANRMAATGKLPALAHPLIGREDDVAQLVTAIRDDQARLLTLTGPGGVGKTSLALAVGAALQSVFGDGVWFVDLAPLTDPGLVLAAIGTVLGVQEEAGRTLRETLGDLLRRRHLMLVLDNMEHVLDAATEISDLLANAAGLTILATSRIPLHLSAEREYAVEPLATGPADARMGSEATDSPAVRLFVERAQAVRPGFRLTEENSWTVAAICARLDGLPLAIELAAARIKMLSPEALLQRLDQRLPILTGGARDHRERQRTLRDTIAWSYDLLSEDERTLFRQLAVFAGGFTLEAAEAVTNPEGTFDSFELLGSLVDKNLVRSDDVAGEPRFRMLETVREFAAIAFAESADHLEIRKHHLDYFTKFAEVAADPTLSYQDQLDGLDRLDAERDNLRSAVAFAIEAGDAEIALQMATMIAGYLRERGEVSEAREWLECALELEPAPVDRRLAALNWAGFLARFQGDVERATYLANTGHAEALAAGNRREEAEALRLLGMIFGGSGDEERGEALLEEALEVFRTIGDKRGVATALSNLGAGMSGRDPERAAQMLRESIALDRELGDRVPNDWVLATLAEIELLLENLERAEELVLEALTTQRQYGLRAGLCWSLQVLGWTRLAQDDPHSAGDAFEEALNVTRETGQNSYLTTLFVGRGRVDLSLGRTTEAAEQFGRALSQIQEYGLSAFWPEEELVLILRDLAEMRLAQGQPDTAARLLGAAQALPQIGLAAMTSESKSREELTDRARSMLDDDVFAREHSAGLGMTPEEILAEAVAQAAAIATGRGKSGTGNRGYDRSM